MPAAAVPALTVSVELAPEVTDAGLNDAVAPLGTPAMLKVTVCAAPEVTAVDMALVPEPLWAMLKVFGLAEIEKSFTAETTVNDTEVVCVAEAPVPVTVIEYVPAGVLAPAVSVSVELLPLVTDAGLNDAVAPAGKPLAERVIVCALPVVNVVEMVLVPDPPGATEMLVGLADIEKSFVEPQPGNLKEAIRVLQLNAPFAGMYSVVYQKVHSSDGSTVIAL